MSRKIDKWYFLVEEDFFLDSKEKWFLLKSFRNWLDVNFEDPCWEPLELTVSFFATLRTQKRVNSVKALNLRQYVTNVESLLLPWDIYCWEKPFVSPPPKKKEKCSMRHRKRQMNQFYDLCSHTIFYPEYLIWVKPDTFQKQISYPT